MSTNAKRAIAIGAGVVVLAVGAFLLLTNRDGGPLDGLPIVGDDEPETCPLSGEEPGKESALDRPAVGLKIENNPAAYPLSGLEEAEVVYEEPVEGGLSRFLAIYHCTDAAQAGPVRSARIVDPAILLPYTHILGAAGGNDIVRAALDEAELVVIDETGAGTAMSRVERPGVSSEHTLYGDTAAIRKLGRKDFDEPPSEVFTFGDAEGTGKKATTITITFSLGNVVSFEWKEGRWYRIDNGQPLIGEGGDQFAADNVLIEEHTVNFAEGISDVIGAPSPEIEDVTGSGRAVLFRDGRAFKGTWTRESEEDRVVFETTAGDEMVLKEGTTWIELVPDDKGDLKGSFEYAK